MRLAVLAVAVALTVAMETTASPQTTAVIVELFTSEGCASCPPADRLLERLVSTQPAAGAEIIGLGQHVDYWDQLGWKDRFSSAALTGRQRLYAARFPNDGIYTPQMVVDGRSEFVGSDAPAARKAIEGALAARHAVVRIAVEPAAADRMAVSVAVAELPAMGRGDRADIMIAVTEDGLRSDVKRGENHGRTLAHAAVVRHLAAVGEALADGPSSVRADIAIDAGWQRENLKVVAFVQERRGRTILGSASAPLGDARR
jgi:hypothetical protein